MQHPHTTPAPALVAADWGTTSLRAWALAPDGAVLGSVRSPHGLRPVTALAAERGVPAGRAFADVLAEVAAGLGADGVPALACGMVGSDGGWSPVPHLRPPLPAVPESFEPHRVPGADPPVWIVPGLRTSPAGASGAPDVIRGEETQVLGALERLGRPEEATLVLPGTHTKWLRVAGGAVTGFTTAMTGEIHAALMEHTILGDPARAAVPTDGGAHPDTTGAAFDAGADHGLAHPERPLAARLFSARTRHLDGEIGAHDVADYVSGLLIADETERMLALTRAAAVVLCADGALGPRYRRALERQGVRARLLEDTALDGLTALARAFGLLRAPAARPSARTSEGPA
ncbi:2-dehydro-3-deoxygalactonokinase [Nocardiopsis sp. RSe5-2]|uniref:2-dehydro-3-deoxygalactonokinase n=1 Tax=Nocardiopsis endophytica TaxID=3018445 RepID=A0ABT4U3K2_9ACTN|nr:2-dehydro-3-deoxygalactonokinase [Nocardiopsis endophytica]MDA2811515.1 2-dehydro-3-deoxygalactonokinase [Nocardiopsis endophytica]